MVVVKVTGWPGQRILVGMQAIDELTFSTAGIVELLPHNSTRTVSHEETLLYSMILSLLIGCKCIHCTKCSTCYT